MTDPSLPLLSSEEISTLLSDVSAWNTDEEATSISRTWILRDFDQAMNFANAIADVARKINHHPSITIDFKKVTITLTTHRVMGLTIHDFLVAKQIDQLPEAIGESVKNESFLAG